MTIRNFALAAGALALGLASLVTPSNAQGPLYDKVLVTLPYSVTIGNRTLQPGDYVIRQLDSPGGGSRVLLIYSDRGMKFETSAMTIPALDNRTPEDTKVILHHFGPDYYFDKIWVQGKNYGYEFPLPDSVKARQRERMEPMSVAARYESVPKTDDSDKITVAQSTTTTTETTTPAPETAATTPAPTPAPVDNSVNTTNDNAVAQNATPAPAVSSTDESSSANNRNMTQGEASRTMPSTSAGWLMMMLGGGMLSGAGLVIRRKR